MFFEKGYNLIDSMKVFWQNINAPAVCTGLVATFFSTMGPGFIVMNAAQQNGLSDATAVSWILGIFACGGLSTMFMSLRYRIPVVIAFSIPGAILLSKVLNQFQFSDVMGAYLVISIAVVVLTVSGLIKKIVEKIPVPIIMGMVSGVFISFGVNLFSDAIKTPSIYGVMLIIFFALTAYKSFSKRFPPIIIAVIAGVILMSHFGLVNQVPLKWEIAKPVFGLPTFNLTAILNISVPLFFLVIGVQNIQAIGVLMAENYKPPVNAMYLTPAIISFFDSFIGAHSSVTAGPSTAICSGQAAGERKDLRFIASLSEGFFWLCFGLLAKIAVDSAQMVPKEFTAVLAGLAMFDVFGSAFKSAFNGQFKYGALTAFFVTTTNVSILGIASPFWGIVFGFVASFVMEHSEFGKNADNNVTEQPVNA